MLNTIIRGAKLGLIIFPANNPDKTEITNYKHQITNKLQITISKSQIRSIANCLEFESLAMWFHMIGHKKNKSMVLKADS
jgi:hypothetical protein